MSTDADRRRESRERYQAVLRTIALNTTERQPPGIRPMTVRLHQSTHGQHASDDVDSTIRAALENGDLLRWRDVEGNVRLTLRAEPDLVRLAQHIGEVLQDPEQLARINQMLGNVMDDPMQLGRATTTTTHDE